MEYSMTGSCEFGRHFTEDVNALGFQGAQMA